MNTYYVFIRPKLFVVYEYIDARKPMSCAYLIKVTESNRRISCFYEQCEGGAGRSSRSKPIRRDRAHINPRSPKYLEWNLAKEELGGFFSIKIRDFKSWKMLKLLNFRFPEE